MTLSRTKKAAINARSSIIYEIVTIACSLILPRLILSHFGSAYNGITTSITQFLTIVSLLSAGVGGVTRAALYKPLAERDVYSISRIVLATEIFLRKVGLIFGIFLLIFAAIYPFFIADQFSIFFSFSLVIILGFGTIVQYCFGLTFQYLLISDQKRNIITNVNIVTTILNTVVAALLIKLGAGIHLVKLGSSMVFLISPIYLYLYCHKNYSIIKNIKPDNSALAQRWDSFAHQVALFVHTNTGVMILTIFTSLKEVSVYSVYSLVVNGIYTTLKSFIPNIDSAFGDMIAKNEKKNMLINFRIFEFVTFSIATVLISCLICMIIPFVKLYTENINDVNYIRPLFSKLIALACFFNSVRIPYQQIVEASGHFKQTKIGAFVEAGLNLSISIICVNSFGLIGVAFGTLSATLFRTIQYSSYLSKKIVPGSLKTCIIHILISLSCIFITCIISDSIPIIPDKNFFVWVTKAVIIGIISTNLVIIADFVFYKDEFTLFLAKLKTLKK